MTYGPFVPAVPYPAFRTVEEARVWAGHVYDALNDLAKRHNALLSEARKDASTDLSGTVNSGDATTDGIIEAIRDALVANALGTND